MPETRYIEEVSYPKGMKAEDKILSSAKIKQIPYEISDKQLDAELEAKAREEAIVEITAKKKIEIKARKV